MRTLRPELLNRTLSQITAWAEQKRWNMGSVPFQVQNAWRHSVGSYWFLPSIILISVVLLSFLTLSIDERLGGQWATQLRGIYSHDPADARALLSTVAGSMITVAGVVFSITIVVLTLASNQFGPRLIRNFMQDKGNQAVLGIFTGTYLYCLLILRRIQSLEDISFVPSVSLACAILLAVLSIAVLIYFIHHVTVFMQVEHVIDEVSQELCGTVNRLFPESKDRDLPTPDSLIQPSKPVCNIPGRGSGYIQSIDQDSLIKLAKQHNGLIALDCRPGDFVMDGATLGSFGPCQKIDETLVTEINASIGLGSRPIPDQDPEFAIRQLVEIAVRALSPGINDPFTAMTCVDRIAEGLGVMSKRSLPSANRQDESGTIRLILLPVTFADLVEAAYNQLRHYACSSLTVSLRMLDSIAMIGPSVPRREDRICLLQQAELIAEQCLENTRQEKDRQDVQRSLERVQDALNIK